MEERLWRSINVTFTTYEEYKVEAENKTEALRITEEELRSNRCSPIANTYYDESDVEEIEE